MKVIPHDFEKSASKKVMIIKCTSIYNFEIPSEQSETQILRMLFSFNNCRVSEVITAQVPITAHCLQILIKNTMRLEKIF